MRVFANVQEILAGDVLVALGVVGEQAGGFQIDIDFAGFRLGSVEAERAAPVLEGTVDEAVTQVADLEVNECVLTFLVDNVVGSHGLASRQQCGTQSQSGERLLQHAFLPVFG